MLNPSVADGLIDDPTVRKCIRFADRWGYGSIEIVNLFAWRSTDPRGLMSAEAKAYGIVGPDNDKAIKVACYRADRVVLAWGASGHPRIVEPRAREVTAQIVSHHTRAPVGHLGYCKDGRTPRHPLMLAYSTPFQVRSSFQVRS